MATLTILAATATSNAGTFTMIKEIEDSEIWVYEGEVTKGDAKKLESIIKRDPHIIMVIDSPGGDALEGFALGRTTSRYRDEITLVAESAYSAAGMWWLADDDGTFLDDESEVGWHLSYMYGKQVPEHTAQVLGYMTGKYLEDMLDEEIATNMMIAMANLQEKEGKFALMTLRKDGKIRTRR